MVILFVGGLALGLPAGCWLRERNYHLRFVKAYQQLVPPSDTPQTDAFRDTRAEFYEDLKKGKADPKDFERYIYGKHAQKQRYTDERDVAEAKQAESKSKIEREFKEYALNEQLYGKKSQ